MIEMQFVYKPEGANPKKWDFAPERLMNAELEVIERKTGLSFNEWQAKIRQGSALAIHGLLFVMLKRTNPTLTWEQVAFSMGEIDFETTDDETRDILVALETSAAAGEITEPEQLLLNQLRENAPAHVLAEAHALLADPAAAGDGEQVSPGNPPSAPVAPVPPDQPTQPSAPAATPTGSPSSDVAGSGLSLITATPHPTPSLA